MILGIAESGFAYIKHKHMGPGRKPQLAREVDGVCAQKQMAPEKPG